MVEKVFALGGSVIKNNLENLDSIADSLPRNEQIIVVTGAGHLKENIDAVREFSNNSEADIVGIKATRLNAKTVETLMKESYPGIPENIQELEKAISTGKNVVMGGLNPGFSTDAVATIAAELCDANLYFLKDVDGLYEEDPRENPEAERLDSVKMETLLDKVSGQNKPGTYSIVDETAVKIIERSKIDTRLIEGTPEKIKSPDKCEGTDIIF